MKTTALREFRYFVAEYVQCVSTFGTWKFLLFIGALLGSVPLWWFYVACFMSIHVPANTEENTRFFYNTTSWVALGSCKKCLLTFGRQIKLATRFLASGFSQGFFGMSPKKQFLLEKGLDGGRCTDGEAPFYPFLDESITSKIPSMMWDL